MKKMTQKDSEIVFYAFRYCLGRMSYAVSDFCEYATENISAIWRHELKLMEKEITEEEKFEDVHSDLVKRYRCGGLGMDCDRRNWLCLREVIREELKRRDEKGLEI